MKERKGIFNNWMEKNRSLLAKDTTENANYKLEIPKYINLNVAGFF